VTARSTPSRTEVDAELLRVRSLSNAFRHGVQWHGEYRRTTASTARGFIAGVAITIALVAGTAAVTVVRHTIDDRNDDNSPTVTYSPADPIEVPTTLSARVP
jgi:hypothetical protein